MLAQLVQGFHSLLFPAACAGCRLPLESGPLCAKCADGLPRPPFPGLPERGRPLDGACSPFLYQGVCRDLILALKYEGRLSLIPFFASNMEEEILRLLGKPPADRVLPVPLHSTRLRERTFNQAELLADAVARRLGIPCETQILIRSRPTRPQAELTREERSRNVRGAFDLRRGSFLKGSRLLLVDDVLTTGATAGACALLLKKAGARSVWIVTAARQPIA